MHNGLVKIITGIRRSGKSYLLSVLFKEYLLGEGVEEDHIVEVPLDKDEFRDYRDAIALGDYVRSHLVNDGKWNYVFIDEVQLARKVLPKGVDLRRIAPEDRDGAYVSFYDTLNTLRQMANVDVYVTGSNSKTLSSDIDSNFADRGTQIRMHPFSFAEYCEATKAEDHLVAFDQYLIWGGMPLA
ncbi:MAG: AAA family ATPase, partial [Kiritimatiellae bacterium]|nr:AAA family ATPase [Kiritimatiellia bacterium]